MNYKVGDRVVVKSKNWYDTKKFLNVGVTCGAYIFAPDMVKFCDQTVTISDVIDDSYLIDEDGGGNVWRDEMFAGFEPVNIFQTIYRNIKDYDYLWCNFLGTVYVEMLNPDTQTIRVLKNMQSYEFNRYGQFNCEPNHDNTPLHVPVSLFPNEDVKSWKELEVVDEWPRKDFGFSYFFVDEVGHIQVTKDFHTDVDDMRYKIHNYFTKEQDAKGSKFWRIYRERES